MWPKSLASAGYVFICVNEENRGKDMIIIYLKSARHVCIVARTESVLKIHAK